MRSREIHSTVFSALFVRCGIAHFGLNDQVAIFAWTQKAKAHQQQATMAQAATNVLLEQHSAQQVEPFLSIWLGLKHNASPLLCQRAASPEAHHVTKTACSAMPPVCSELSCVTMMQPGPLVSLVQKA